MPTIPTPPSGSPHQHRAVAESFGTDPARYDRARPRYPDELIARILAGLPGPEVLDVGTGTGIVARQVRAAGGHVVGVEPDERMAAAARATGIPVEVATFERWDPAGRMVDAVVAGQAWHWVDPVAGAAKAAQVLRPGGRLAVFWNADEPPAEAAAALAEAYRRLAPPSTPAPGSTSPLASTRARAVTPATPAPAATPDQASGAAPERPVSVAAAYATMAGRAADSMRAAGAYDEPERWEFRGERSYTRESWLEYVATTGFFTHAAAGLRAEVLAAIGAAVPETVTVRFTTVATTALRTA